MYAPRRALLLFPFLTMFYVSTAGVAQAAAPPRFQTVRDVEYARPGGESLLLDASVPESGPAVPAVIIVHGGGWVRGDRRYDVQPLFKPLNDAGFAWFSIDYRFATDVTRFGVGIEDVGAAIRFVKSRAAEFHIDAERVALIGESAGGQLAAMAALRADAADSVRGVVAFYTPTDLVSLVKDSVYVPASIRNQIHGTPWEKVILAGLATLSPIENVRRGMPPFLFIHGDEDSLVPIAQSSAMCKRMKAVRASCEVFPLEGAGHGLRWWQSDSRIVSTYQRKMIAWLDAQLNQPRVSS